MRHAQCWLGMAALVLIAFSLRIAVALYFGLNAPPEAGSDSAEYDQYAWNLANGRGYRGISPDVSDTDHLTAYRPPGLPLVWAGLYSVFGHNHSVVRVADCLWGALTCLVVLSIGRRCFNSRVGWLAALVWTVWPLSLLYCSQLLSEPLTTLCFSSYLFACLCFAAQPSGKRALVAGTLLGATLLIHPTKLFMLPLALVWAFWQFRDNRRAMWLAGGIPICALIALIPWTARNYYVFGEFIPFSTMGGSALLQANNRIVVSEPRYYGYPVWDTKIPEYRELLQAPNDELERDRVAKRLAIQWLKDNPDKWPFLVQAKLRRAFTPFLQPDTPAHYRYGMLLSWGPVLLLFSLAVIPTCVTFLRTNHPGWLMHLGVLHFVILTVIFFGYSRYRHPIEPLCIIFAAATLDCVLVKLNLDKQCSRGRLPLPRVY